MEDTIAAGDCIVVDKLSYGGLLPRRITDIPLANVLTIYKSIRETDRLRDWRYGRVPGLSRIKRGDIIVFMHPKENIIKLVKRCVALPGDTIRIENGAVLINGSRVNFPSTVKLPKPDNTGCSKIYPCGNSTGISSDFGPIVVPAQGETLALDTTNVALYKNFICLEDHELICLGAEIYIDGIEVTEYTFKTDGYFVLGDHRSLSIDSRYFGIVPSELIIGKAVFVYFSSDPNTKHIRWNRTGKLFK